MGDSGTATIDRLEKIVSSKEEMVEVDGRSIRVLKWNLTQTLRLATTLTRMVRQVVSELPINGGKDADTAGFFARLLGADLAKLAEGQHDNIRTIISETIVRGNFDSLDETQKFVEENGVEALELLSVIARQNMRPLVRAIKNVLASVKSVRGVPKA